MKKILQSKWGCLLKGVMTLIVIVALLVLLIKISNYRRRQHPFFAEKELVEAFSGLEFPKYTVIETDRYLCQSNLRFDSIPDKSFYDKLDSLSNISYVCKRRSDGLLDTLHIWYYDDSQKLYFLNVFNEVYEKYEVNPFMEALINQGVPENFFLYHQLNYGIIIFRERAEWEIFYYD
jgi:hypothetical protein